MATRDLKVKFSVDASEVTSGSQEAKDKIKKAADQMASDVKSSSEKMKDSFDGVAKSTEKISDASKTATNAVKQMETEVKSSAKSMEQSIDDVSKKMSVMMGARAAATGMRMLGTAVQSYGPAVGMSEETAGITGSTLAGAASGVAMGAQLGTVLGGPGMGTAIGAAAGALVGAGASLLKAGQELQKAAASEQEKQAIRGEQVRQMREADATKKNISKWQDLSLEDLQKERDERAAGLEMYKSQLDVFKAGLDPFSVTDKDLRDVEFSQNRIDNYQNQLNLLDDMIRQRSEGLLQGWNFGEEDYVPQNKEFDFSAYQQFAMNEAAAEAAEAAAKEREKNLNTDLREGERTLADLQAQLNGQMSRTVGGPADQLTKIGGGGGYAGYNNSVEQVQKKIESNLNQLVKNQQNQNQEIINKLTELTQKEGSGDATWASP